MRNNFEKKVEIFILIKVRTTIGNIGSGLENG